MKKIIRWQGLVAVAALAVVLSGAWYFLIDDFAKGKIQEYATQAVGAKVELEGVDLALFPAGMVITGLKITNPEKPMTNAVEIARLDCTIKLPWLASGKVVIERMSIDGVWLNTPRETSGAISDKPVAKPKKTGLRLKLPSFNQIPDVDEILQKEELRSLKLIETIRDDVDTIKGKWQKQVAGLSDKDKIQNYQQRLKEMTSFKQSDLMSIFSRADDSMSLHKELSQEIELIKSARVDLKRDLELLQKRIYEAENAPAEDVRRLKEKYTLSAQGVANMSKTLFGNKIGDRAETALLWYDRIRPFLEQGEGHETFPAGEKGVNIRFKEHTPDFLVRAAHISSIETKVGVLSGVIENIASPQHVLGVPLTFDFSGEDKIQSIELDGQIDHTDPSKANDTISFRVKGYKASNLPLYDDPRQPVSLEKGSLDIDLQASLSGEELVARLQASLYDAKLSPIKKEGDNPLIALLDSSLSDISQFTLVADITGTRDNYQTNITSDLDRILADALGQQAEKQSLELAKKLQPAIYEKTGGAMRELKGSMTGLEAIDGDLAERLKQASGLL